MQITETIATIIQMQQRFVHANLNLVESIEPALDLPTSRVDGVDIQVALNNSFGFGGINTCILFKACG